MTFFWLFKEAKCIYYTSILAIVFPSPHFDGMCEIFFSSNLLGSLPFLNSSRGSGRKYVKMRNARDRPFFEAVWQGRREDKGY